MTETASRVEVARVGPEHIPALTQFYRDVWDPDATPERVEATRAHAATRNRVTPGEPPPTWLVIKNGRAIGHVTTIPVMLWLDGREHPAHWIKGLWVLPEHQRSAAGFLVLRAAADAIQPALAVAHEPAAVRLFTALGFTDLGTLPNDLRVLRARGVLGRLDVDAAGFGGLPPGIRFAVRVASGGASVFGPVVDAVFGLWAALATGPLGRFAVEVGPDLDRDAADALWSRVRDEVRAGAVRDAATLAERYAGTGEYRFVHARANGHLAGLAVVKSPRADGDPRLRGIRVATVSDVLFAPSQPRAGLALLRGAERAARALGADALLCGASPDGVHRLTRRRGCVRLSGNLHVLARFPKEAAAPRPPLRLGEWWVTRGDSEADGTF